MSQWAFLNRLLERRAKFFRPLLFFDHIPVRLVLLFITAVTVTVFISDNSAIADVLLQQSPTSPPQDQPPPEPEQPQPAPAEPQQPAQPEQPAQSSSESISPVSPVTPTEEAQPVIIEPQPLPPPLPEPTQPSAQSRQTASQEASDQSLVLDEAEFIDTVIVSAAYVWLCCGIILLLFIPLVFIFLHIRGRSKIIKEDIL